MTFVLTANTPEAIWILADRRLSYPNRPSKEDGCKLTSLETDDGLALFGYAGLGATGIGNEPSEWASNVLRGRRLPLEDCLGALVEAMRMQFPRHLARMPHPRHITLVSAIVNEEVRLYAIDVVAVPGQKGFEVRWNRLAVPTTTKPPRIVAAGTGSIHLEAIPDKLWTRHVLRLVSQHDKGRLPALKVADWLAGLNLRVSRGVADGSVGPRCIVAWRYRKGGVHGGGGGSQYYTETARDEKSPAIPTISVGLDIRAIADILKSHSVAALKSMAEGHDPPSTDVDVINAELSSLPQGPDERLS